MTPGEPDADATDPETHIVFGNGAITGNIDSGGDIGHIAIGEGASTQLSSSFDRPGAIAIGYNATASNLSATALGRDATASGSFSTALGYSTTASGLRCTALGHNATASDSNALAIGNGSTASDSYATALGSFSEASGAFSVAIGRDTSAGYNYSLAFGRGATTDKSNQFVLGSSDYPINELRLGEQSSGAPLIFADQNGVGFGTTSPAYKLDVVGNGRFKSSDQPVLDLTQDDIDNAFIRLEGAAQDLSSSLVDPDDVSSETIEGYFKVEVEDRENQITTGTYYVPFYNLS